jgi:hypothetical protein
MEAKKMVFDRAKYYRRRQFVLGPEYLDYFGWKKIKITEGLHLTVHPDLSVTSAAKDDRTATLLGYVIDAYSPGKGNEEILRGFIEQPISLENIFPILERLCGRFVLIITGPDISVLFHDACGLRQVNYCLNGNNSIWCASQPETLAEKFGYSYDEEAIAFRKLPEFRMSLEDFALVNTKTPYREVKYLLANHYLDLKHGTAHRYWPVPGCFTPLSVPESIQRCSRLLRNAVGAAARRFELKAGITAGSDSRKSLAAARDVKDLIYFFTHTPMTSHKVDWEVPSRLLPKLGLEHHRLDVSEMSPDFRALYEASATWARERHGHIAFSALNHFGPDATVLNSNISEYSQVWYWLPKSMINGTGVAILKGLNSPAAISDFQAWYELARPVCDQCEMNVLVLFQLELRSRWVANTYAECDIAYESFNPYNNRAIFCAELSVKESKRRGRYRLDIPKKQIRDMWPEALAEPINPGRGLSKVKKFMIRSVVHKTITPWLPITEYIRYRKGKRAFYKQIS